MVHILEKAKIQNGRLNAKTVSNGGGNAQSRFADRYQPLLLLCGTLTARFTLIHCLISTKWSAQHKTDSAELRLYSGVGEDCYVKNTRRRIIFRTFFSPNSLHGSYKQAWSRRRLGRLRWLRTLNQIRLFSMRCG